MGRYKGDNSGGYGNPPIDGQFKPNGPPGPGRPKGSTSIDGALKKVFGGKVPYRENGKPVEGPATEALSKRALQLGLSGPHRANAAALDLARRYGPQEDAEEAVPFPNLGELTQCELRDLTRLLAKATGDASWEPERNDGPLAYLDDPNDPRNYIEELTVEGIHYRQCKITTIDDQILAIHSRAYFSAALPRRNGCYRLDVPFSRGSRG